MNQPPFYLLIVAIVEGDPDGAPRVIKAEEFDALQSHADEVTGGNGGFQILAEITEDYQVISKTVSACDNKTCTYYNHYQLYFQPSEDFPVQFSHEAFHAAEQRCELAQKALIAFLENPVNAGKEAPEHLTRQADHWEKAVCA